MRIIINRHQRPFIPVFLAILLIMISISACGPKEGNDAKNSELTASQSDNGEDQAAAEAEAPDSAVPSNPDDPEEAFADPTSSKVAIICENREGSGFVKPIIEMAESLSEDMGFELRVMDCINTMDWEDNYVTAANEGYDLIIGVGWTAADYARIEAAKDINTAAYALIDADAHSEDVTSIEYDSLEASYVLGVMAATAFPDEKVFGGICSFGDSYVKAFEEGLLSVNPEAELKTELTFSYSDAGMAHDIALSMGAEGIKFIYFTAGASFKGIYDAALELAAEGSPIYTVCQDWDETTEENPYILAAQLKKTDLAVKEIIEGYFSGTLEKGVITKDFSDESIGISNITEPGNYLNSDILTDEVIKTSRQAANAFLDGTVHLETHPDDLNEVIN